MKYIYNIGKAIKNLEDGMENQIWYDLSKHNQYWDSEHETEDNKLEDIRLHLSFMKETIYNLLEKIEDFGEDF